MARTDIDVRGDHVVGVKCPKCKKKRVLYNGNYFCGECTWIMDDRRSLTNDRITVAYLRQRRNIAVDLEERKRMEFYLDEILDRRLR